MRACLLLLVSSAACATASRPPAPVVPLVDHHKHLASPGAAALVSKPENPYEPVDAAQLIAQLDEAGIGRAVVLSVAYWYGAPRFHLPDELAQVRRENDWTAAQAARFPRRLVAFCSVNPLKDYAVAEVERCARTPGLRGLKLHLGNAKIELDDPGQVAAVRRVFEAANHLRLPIVLHVPGPTPAEAWRQFQQLPLTEGELRQIARNVAPYLR